MAQLSINGILRDNSTRGGAVPVCPSRAIPCDFPHFREKRRNFAPLLPSPQRAFPAKMEQA
jgi:hypothetical protein